MYDVPISEKMYWVKGVFNYLQDFVSLTFVWTVIFDRPLIIVL